MERKTWKKNVSKKIFVPISQANYGAKILTDVLPYIQDISVQGKKAKSSRTNLSLIASARKMLTLTYLIILKAQTRKVSNLRM